MTKGQQLVLVLVGIVTALTVLAVGGQSRFDGPLLVTMGHDHGFHLGNLIPVTCWLVGMATCLRLWRSFSVEGAAG